MSNRSVVVGAVRSQAVPEQDIGRGIAIRALQSQCGVKVVTTFGLGVPLEDEQGTESRIAADTAGRLIAAATQRDDLLCHISLRMRGIRSCERVLKLARRQLIIKATLRGLKARAWLGCGTAGSLHSAGIAVDGRRCGRSGLVASGQSQRDRERTKKFQWPRRGHRVSILR